MLPAEKNVVVSVSYVVLQKERGQTPRFCKLNQLVVNTLPEKQAPLSWRDAEELMDEKGP